jgi:hypothetical protein
MKQSWSSLAIALGLTIGWEPWSAPALAQGGYEAPAVLRATDLVPAELLQDPRYRIEELVTTDGLQAKVLLRSELGDFEAEGPGMVAVRAAEIKALDVLSKTETSEIFQKALQASLKRTGQSLKTAVTRPVETIKGVPAGVGRFFDRVSRDVKTGGQKVGDRVGEMEASKTKGESGPGMGQVAQEAGQGMATAGESVIGYDDSRRRLAKYLGVDPYTTNPALSQKLDGAAWAVWGGEFGPDQVIGFVPGGFALRFTRDWVSDLVWDMTPGDLRVRMEGQLKGLGVEQEPIDRFLRQKWFTNTIRLALADSLVALGPGPGRPDVIAWALTAESETQARFMAGSVAILARHHQTARPVARVRVDRTVLGETADGAVVVPAAVDYVSWTERVATFAGRPDLRVKDRRLWLAGTLSPRARQELTARGWTITEGVSIVPPALPGAPRS